MGLVPVKRQLFFFKLCKAHRSNMWDTKEAKILRNIYFNYIFSSKNSGQYDEKNKSS